LCFSPLSPIFQLYHDLRREFERKKIENLADMSKYISGKREAW
jgi:hypothetical protein